MTVQLTFHTSILGIEPGSAARWLRPGPRSGQWAGQAAAAAREDTTNRTTVRAQLETYLSTHKESSNQGAAGIVASLADVAKRDQARYSGRELPRKLQREHERLMSMRTAKPIRGTLTSDPQGFGLGVAPATTSATGTFRFHEGTTFGYRVLHLYSPRSGINIVVAANSSSDQDGLSKLGLAIYKLVNPSG